jgi:hypothetical protein
MKPTRKVSRRSFLNRVAGAAAGGAFLLVSGEAHAQVSDHDPTDPIGRGRGGGTGVTDSDTGPGADPRGRGRGGSAPGSTGVTDSDSGANADAVGRGRGGSGITDTDSGPYADPRGRGRGGQRGPSANDGYSPAERQARCDNNRRRYAELSQEGSTPESWTEDQLRVAEADERALNGANEMRRHSSGDAEIFERAWAIAWRIAARYGIPITRSSDWFEVVRRLNEQMARARTSTLRAARLRELQNVRTNLAALGC